MTRNVLIAIGAGIVSAIAFVSVALGQTGLGLILFLILPLPILLAGLALGWQAALISGLTATLVVLIAGSPAAALAFAACQAAPPVVLSYLALLNRPTEDPDGREWYPTGRLVLTCAIIGALLSIALVLGLGSTPESVKAQIGPVIEPMLKAQIEQAGEASGFTVADIPKFVDTFVALLPALTATSIMVMYLFNLWLAGRLTLASGQLARPWPDLGGLQFPRFTPLALAVTTGLSFLDGFPGIAGGAFSGVLFLAYAVLGLAVVHAVTRGRSWRPFALWALYFAVLFLYPALLLVAVVGLIDGIWPLRGARDEG